MMVFIAGLVMLFIGFALGFFYALWWSRETAEDALAAARQAIKDAKEEQAKNEALFNRMTALSNVIAERLQENQRRIDSHV